MAGPESLDSDRVNFLVWRYLLESNYRETAAKLQKEWHIKEPHRHFTWAPHVKGHALVSVINRGLIYQALERDCARAQKTPPGDTPLDDVPYGIFGPLVPHQPSTVEEVSLPEVDDAELSRKRAQQDYHMTNGQAAKRPRLSNGYENGLSINTDTMPMDVDQANDQDHSSSDHNHDQHVHDTHENHDNAYPSPIEIEQAPSPISRTDGPEQGTQIDKVEELASQTTFVELVDDLMEPQSPMVTGTGPGAGAGVENPPILLQCEWNPINPSLLAGAGTDALGRVWTVSRPTGPATPDQDHVPPSRVMLVAPEWPRDTTVTALAWASDGNTIAVATDQDSPKITIWTTDGSHVQDINVDDGPILKLSWNPSNTALLAITSDEKGGVVTVHYPPTGLSSSYAISEDRGFDFNGNLDATWESDWGVVICAGKDIIVLSCANDSTQAYFRSISSIAATRERKDYMVQVAIDRHSNLMATSSEAGYLDVWEYHRKTWTASAHAGPITTMAWQPLASIQAIDDKRLIATGGEDGSIHIWNARGSDQEPMFTYTMDAPVLRLAFTPDGAFIAGATSNQVLIWKVGSLILPRASWSRPAEPGWLSPRSASESEEEDECCLCWDASGQKLAYGSSSKLAVINFSR